jgi:hypothetical protein
VGVGAHAPSAPGGEFPQLRDETAVVVKELLRLIAPQPTVENLQALGVLTRGIPSRHVFAVADIREDIGVSWFAALLRRVERIAVASHGCP